MDNSELFNIADKFFIEMRKAEDDKDYKAYMKNCDYREDEELTEEIFLRELDEMGEEWGAYLGREFLTSAKDFKPERTRFFWKAKFEKGETVVALGLLNNEFGYQVDEFFYF